MFEKSKRLPVIHGILFVALFACSAFYIADTAWFRYLSFSPLIIGVLLGMMYANTLRGRMPQEWTPGVVFCSKKLLRLAIVLYGFRLTFQHVVHIGMHAVAVDLIMITGTIILGLLVGKLLKLDRDLTLLTSTGSAICGAAAVLGTESVLNNKPHQTTVAVSTVVIFGTIAMFLYPAMYRVGFFTLGEEQWALYTGSTVHEVAHVVGAGNAMSEAIASSSVIVKMIRVIFLAPVLLIYSFFVSRKNRMTKGAGKASAKISIPWFAIGFIVVIGFNSLGLLPGMVVDSINYIDTFLLTMAMTALGMETTFRKFSEAGFKPFVLALILFVWLLFGGYAVTRYL